MEFSHTLLSPGAFLLLRGFFVVAKPAQNYLRTSRVLIRNHNSTTNEAFPGGVTKTKAAKGGASRSPFPGKPHLLDAVIRSLNTLRTISDNGAYFDALSARPLRNISLTVASK
jgi:hypothetical protein